MMFPAFADTEKDNYWHIDFNRSVDFAIWTLERDGLHVPPFTGYPSLLGNNLLTDAGFTSANWQAWFDKIISSVPYHPDSVSSSGSAPWQLCDVNSEIQAVLQTLWQCYLPISNARQGATKAFTDQLLSQKNLQDVLRVDKAAADDMPLTIFLTGYPVALVHVKSPGVIILAPAGGLISEAHLKPILHDGLRPSSNVPMD